MFYFADAPTLLVELFTGQAAFVAYAFIGSLTATTFIFGGFMQEQVCTYMCPWPRIQAAMMDPHAIDAHSQGILEYAKVKAMLAGYAASSLGRSAIGTLEPMTRFDLVAAAVAETSELRTVLQRKGRLPMAGMTDVRPVVAGEEGAASIIEPHVLRDVRNTLLGIEYLWGAPVILETSEVQSINRDDDEPDAEPAVKWQRVRYTMKDRKLSRGLI